MVRFTNLLGLAFVGLAISSPTPFEEDEDLYFSLAEFPPLAPEPAADDEIFNITSAVEISAEEVLSADILPEDDIEKRQSGCAAGVYMIVARGSGEPQGPGRLRTVVNGISQRIPGSVFTSVVYPATIAGFDDPLYPSSVREGIRQVQALIRARVNRCPRERIVLLGYSQGANAVATGLAGSGFGNPRLPAEFHSNIRGVSLFACPTQAADQRYNRGTAPFADGILGRTWVSLPNLNIFSNRLVQYCDLGDVVCGHSHPPWQSSVHSNVVGKYSNAAVNFIASVAR